MAFFAGAYSLTLAGDLIGITDDGIYLDGENNISPIRGDNMGQTVQDSVVRGGNLYAGGVIIPGTDNMAALLVSLWPSGTAYGTVDQIGYIIPKLACVIARLDAGSGTIPVSITATTGVSIAPGFRSRLNLQSDFRRIPIQLIFYPNASRVLATIT